MAKETVYILSEEMRVHQSPFYMEGTDIQYNIPDEYPLPMECVIHENGTPIELRCIPSSKFVEKQRQIDEEKRPANWEPSENDRKLLTFKFGRLAVDEEKNKTVAEFLRRAGWLVGNEKNRVPGTRPIYEKYDEDLLVEKELEKEELSLKASNMVLALDDAALDNLYILSLSGVIPSEQISQKKKKSHLLSIARVSPEFIINGAKSTKDKASIVVHKAIEFKILTLEIANYASIVGPKGEWEPLMELSDVGGPEGKFSRFVEYVMTEGGKPILQTLETKVQEAEEKALAKV